MVMITVPRDNAVGKPEFHRILRDWYVNTSELTIGDTGKFGGKPWIYIHGESGTYHLNADTKRAGVAEYLALATEFGDQLEWSLRESQRGKMTRVEYGPQSQKIRGFYLYLG